MPRLLLLRHAKSSWDEDGLADFDRPLNERGRAAATAIGRYLAAQKVVPDRLMVSPARRTRETIERVLAEVSGWPKPQYDDRIYEASSGDLSRIISETPAGTESLMLVGHNPGLGFIAAQLGGARAAVELGKFPTGSLAIIELSEPWAEAHSGTLAAFVKPRDL
ncbi:histidine phosphatase family protein [Sphingomonas sp. HDW15A]|uniref:SixA phosphatase family protein n=1 Tax=Sphingomonas sp. HDW15A TaxID=2714942 RepID=UPI00140B2235|nr:histidine phosphatase family protein [Sphingomonas sp. HDW15A]QIK95194.1 histidine phosphatase family protein [Sphingomonas sp. HDW15A]